MAQQVGDLALALPLLESLLWCGFRPWPGNVHMQQSQPPEKNKKKKRGNCLL